MEIIEGRFVMIDYKIYREVTTLENGYRTLLINAAKFQAAKLDKAVKTRTRASKSALVIFGDTDKENEKKIAERYPNDVLNTIRHLLTNIVSDNSN